jgi:hypothetical protein
MPRNRTAEVAANNLFDAQLDSADAALMTAVNHAIAAVGGVDEPQHAVDPDGPAANPLMFADDKVEAQSAKVRLCVSIEELEGRPLTRLCKYHPPSRCGNGTATTPHITLPAALHSVYLGERVELIKGTYDECHVALVEGTLMDEVIVCPRGYMTNMLLLAPEIARRRLDDGDRERFDRVVMTLAADRPQSEPIVWFHQCSNIALRGFVLAKSQFAVKSTDSPECVLAHCAIDSHKPFTSTADVVIDEKTNVVVSSASSLRRKIQAGALPHQVRWPGYLLAAALFVFFALFCLFLTANFTDEMANDWIIRCSVSAAFSALIVEPTVLVGITSFVVVNSVLQAAVGQLRSFTPLNVDVPQL